MGLFGRRQRGRHASDDVAEDAERDSYAAGEIYDDDTDADGEFGGPYDEDERPDDELVRLDLGSVQVPLPPNAQIQVEMDPSGPLRAVHIISANARYTISAYASPRSMLLWPEISAELAEQLGGDGARVRKETGEWGTELVALVNNVLLRFVGVDGPRWMLRAVAQGPREQSAQAADELRDIVRETIVIRGVQPMPVRTPLPLKLPDEIAAHIEQAQGGAQG